MDVNIAFFLGNPKEEVYIIQPQGYMSKEFSDKVYRLRWSIHELKQASSELEHEI